MAPSRFSRTGVVLGVALICTLLWGSAFPGVKIGYDLFAIDGADIPSKLVFAGTRFLLAGVMVLLFAGFSQRRFPLPKTGRAWSWIIVLGLVQTALQYLFFYIGLANTTSVKASILNSTGSFCAVLLSPLFFRDDKLSPLKILGCALGFGGCVLVNLNGEGLGGFSFFGEGFILFAALSFAVGFLLNKKATDYADSATVTGWQLALGGAVLLAAGMALGGKLKPTGWQSVALLFYLALLSAVAFGLWSELLKHNPVSRVTIYNFLVPVFGTALSLLFLDEGAPDWKTPAALALVCLGIFLVNRKKKNRA